MNLRNYLENVRAKVDILPQAKIGDTLKAILLYGNSNQGINVNINNAKKLGSGLFEFKIDQSNQEFTDAVKKTLLNSPIGKDLAPKIDKMISMIQGLPVKVHDKIEIFISENGIQFK